MITGRYQLAILDHRIEMLDVPKVVSGVFWPWNQTVPLCHERDLTRKTLNHRFIWILLVLYLFAQFVSNSLKSGARKIEWNHFRWPHPSLTNWYLIVKQWRSPLFYRFSRNVSPVVLQSFVVLSRFDMVTNALFWSFDNITATNTFRLCMCMDYVYGWIARFVWCQNFSYAAATASANASDKTALYKLCFSYVVITPKFISVEFVSYTLAVALLWASLNLNLFVSVMKTLFQSNEIRRHIKHLNQN